jgi:hypothetical protein
MITPEFYRQIMAETRASDRRFGEECLRLARQAVHSGSIERSASGALTLAHGGPKPSIIEVARAYCYNCRRQSRMVAFANEPQDVFCDECGRDYQAVGP